MPIILGILLVLFVFISIRLVSNTRPETLISLFKIILGAFAIVIVTLLILSGRFLNVIMGLGVLIPLLPTLKNFFKKAGVDHNHNSSSLSSMTIQQAREILEVSIDATADDIQAAHRRLIQKIHPDQGGSDYLAAQVNRAKDLLLEHLNS